MANLSNINNKFIVTDGGNVLIGQTSAVGTPILQVTGTNHLVTFKNTSTTANTYAQLLIQAGDATNYIWTAAQNSTNWAGSRSLNIYTAQTGANIGFFTEGDASNTKLMILGDGNVGIGTNSPDAILNISKTSFSTTFTSADSYIRIGKGENATNGYQFIGFGYNNGSADLVPAYIGYQQTGTPGNYTKGDLVFGTRNVTTNTAPTERMRITSGGAIEANNGGEFIVKSNGTNNSFIKYYYNSSFNCGLEAIGDRGLKLFSNTGDSSGKLVFETEGTERMRIDSSGRTIIQSGTLTTPAYTPAQGYPLHVQGTSQCFISIGRSGQTTGSQGMIVGLDSTTSYLWNRDNINISFGINDLEKLRIQNSAQSLRVQGGSTTGSNYMQFVNSAGTAQGYFGYGGASNILYIVQQVDGDIQFYSNGSTRMTINTAGDVGIGVAPEGNIVSYIKQLRIGEQTTIQGHSDGVGGASASWFSTNYIFSVGGATTINTGESMVYQVQSGRHHFSNSESTAAGAVPVLRDGFSIEPNLDLKASTKQQGSGGVGTVVTPPYNLRFNAFNGTGPKFLGVYPLRAGSQFLDIAINTTSDNIMYYAMFRGYFYGRGSRWSWTAGYTYQGSIINVQNHFVLNGNAANLTAYRGAAGSAYPANLCLRMDSGSSGYTEGYGELYMFAHSNSLQNAFQVAAFSENNAANPGLWT